MANGNDNGEPPRPAPRLTEDLVEITRMLQRQPIDQTILENAARYTEPRARIRPRGGRLVVDFPDYPAAAALNTDFVTPLQPERGFVSTARAMMSDINSLFNLGRTARRVNATVMGFEEDPEWLRARHRIAAEMFLGLQKQNILPLEHLYGIQQVVMTSANERQAMARLDEYSQTIFDEKVIGQAPLFHQLTAGLSAMVLDPTMYAGIGLANRLGVAAKIPMFVKAKQGERLGLLAGAGRNVLEGAMISGLNQGVREVRDRTLPGINEIDAKQHFTEFMINAAFDAGIVTLFHPLVSGIRRAALGADPVARIKELADQNKQPIKIEHFTDDDFGGQVWRPQDTSKLPRLGEIDVMPRGGETPAVRGVLTNVRLRSGGDSAFTISPRDGSTRTVLVDDAEAMRILDEVRHDPAGQPVEIAIELDGPGRGLDGPVRVGDGDVQLPDPLERVLANVAAGRQLDPLTQRWMELELARVHGAENVHAPKQIQKIAQNVVKAIEARRAEAAVIEKAGAKQDLDITMRRSLDIDDVDGNRVEGLFTGVTRDPEGRPIATFEDHAPVRVSERTFHRLKAADSGLARPVPPPDPEAARVKIPRPKGGEPTIPEGYHATDDPYVVRSGDIRESPATLLADHGNQKVLKQMTTADVVEVGEAAKPSRGNVHTPEEMAAKSSQEVNQTARQLDRFDTAVDTELHKRAIAERLDEIAELKSRLRVKGARSRKQSTVRRRIKELEAEVADLQRGIDENVRFDEALQTLKPADEYRALIKLVRDRRGGHLREAARGSQARFGSQSWHEHWARLYDWLEDQFVLRGVAAMTELFDRTGEFIGDAASKQRLAREIGETDGPIGILRGSSRRGLARVLGVAEGADAGVGGRAAAPPELEISTAADIVALKAATFSAEAGPGQITKTLTMDSKRNPVKGQQAVTMSGAGTLELARKQADVIRQTLAQNRVVDERSWARAVGRATNLRSVLEAPGWIMKVLRDPMEAVRHLGKLDAEQSVMVKDAFETLAANREHWESGKATPEDTAMLIMWGTLSKQKAPYFQESAFIDLVAQDVQRFAKQAMEGKFDIVEYETWIKSTAFPEGTPGRPATDNAVSYGHDFLLKVNADPGIMLKLHDIFSDFSVPSVEARLRYLDTIHNSGIGPKVLSFAMLAQGRTDVLVLDRVQTRLWWDAREKYNGLDLYSLPLEGKQLGLANQFTKSHVGLLYPALIEDTLSRAIPDNVAAGLPNYKNGDDYIRWIYRQLGREEDASMGRFHWESWVVESQQEVGHPTLKWFANRVGTPGDPYRHMAVKEGTRNNINFGATYFWKNGTERVVHYTDSQGKVWEMEPERFRAMIKRIKHPRWGVVRGKIDQSKAPGKLTLSARGVDVFDTEVHPNADTTPWFNLKDEQGNPLVNREELDRIIREHAKRKQVEVDTARRETRVLGSTRDNLLPGSAGLDANGQPLPPQATPTASSPPPELPSVQADGVVSTKGDRLIAVHWSDVDGLAEINPPAEAAFGLGGKLESFYGKGGEMDHAYMVVGDDGKPFIIKHDDVGEIALYDMWVDDAGIRAGAETQAAAEARLVELGYKGYYHSDSPDAIFRGQVRVFGKTKVKPYNGEMVNDAFAFYTYGIDDLTPDQAIARVGTDGHKVYMGWADKVDDAMGFRDRETRSAVVIGDDGNEATFVTRYQGNVTNKMVQYALAQKIKAGRHKAGLIFEVDPEGTHQMHTIRVEKATTPEVIAAAQKAGIKNQTVVQSGAAHEVHVIDRDGTLADSIQKAKRALNGEVTTRHGTATTLGPKRTGADDATARATSEQFFDSIIREYESRPGNPIVRPEAPRSVRLRKRTQGILDERIARGEEGAQGVTQPPAPPGDGGGPTFEAGGFLPARRPRPKAVEPAPEPPSPSREDPEIQPGDQLDPLTPYDVGDLPTMAGADLGSTRPEGKPTSPDAVEFINDRPIDKFVRNFPGASRRWRKSRLQASRSVMGRLFGIHMFNPVGATYKGFAEGTLSGSTSMEQLVRTVSGFTDRPTAQLITEAAILKRGDSSLINLQKAAEARGEVGPLVQSFVETFPLLQTGAKQLELRVLDLSDMLGHARLFSDSIDNVKGFREVFDQLPPQRQDYIREIADRYGMTVDDFVPIIDRLIDSRRGIGERSVMQTFLTTFMDQLAVFRFKDNATIQSFVDVAHVLADGEGKAPRWTSPEGEALLRGELRMRTDYLPEGWQKMFVDETPQSMAKLEDMKTRFNKNFLGHAGRKFTKRLLLLDGPDGKPLLRAHEDTSLMRFRVLMRKMAFLQKLRVMEAEYRSMAQGEQLPALESIPEGDFAPKIIAAKFTTDIEQGINREIQARVGAMLDAMKQERGRDRKHGIKIDRDIRAIEKEARLWSGQDANLSPGAEMMAEVAQSLGRAALLGGVQVAQLADYGMFAGMAISNAFVHGFDPMMRSAEGLAKLWGRVTPEERGASAPIWHMLDMLVHNRGSGNARLLMDLESPVFDQLRIDQSIRNFEPEGTLDSIKFRSADLGRRFANQAANLTTLGTMSLTNRLRGWIFDYHRVLSSTQIPQLAEGIRAGMKPLEAIDHFKLDRRLMLSFLESVSPDDLLRIADLIKNGDMFQTIRKGGTEFIVPIGMAADSGDPALQALAKKAATRRAAGDPANLTLAEIEKLTGTIQEEQAMAVYTGWLNNSVKERIVTPQAANRFLGQDQSAMLRSVLFLFSFIATFEDQMWRTVANSRRESVGLVSAAMAMSAGVWMIRGILKDDMDDRIARARENPFKFMFERLAWSGTMGAIGEQVGHHLMDFSSEKDLAKVRMGMMDRGLSLPMISAINNLYRNSASLAAAFAATPGHVSENEFKRMWGFFSVLEASPYQGLAQVLRRFKVPGFNDAHPLRDIAMYSELFDVRTGRGRRRRQVTREEREARLERERKGLAELLRSE